MFVITLLICAIYILYLSLRYFILDEYSDYMYHPYGGQDIIYETEDAYSQLTTNEVEQNILQELIQTEETYVADLKKIHKYLDTIKYCVTSYDDPLKIYLNILDTINIDDSIIKIHTSLVDEFKDADYGTELYTYKICRWIFDNFEKIEQAYVNYGRSYTSLSKLYDIMKKKCQGLNINKLEYMNDIIKPIQRLPRYKLLLTELQKKMNKNTIIQSLVNHTIKFIGRYIEMYNDKLKHDMPKYYTNLEKDRYDKDISVAHYNPDIQLFGILVDMNFPNDIMKYITVESPLKVINSYRGKDTSSSGDNYLYIFLCNSCIICIENASQSGIISKIISTFKDTAIKQNYNIKYIFPLNNTEISYLKTSGWDQAKKSIINITYTENLLSKSLQINFGLVKIASDFIQTAKQNNYTIVKK